MKSKKLLTKWLLAWRTSCVSYWIGKKGDKPHLLTEFICAGQSGEGDVHELKLHFEF